MPNVIEFDSWELFINKIKNNSIADLISSSSSSSSSSSRFGSDLDLGVTNYAKLNKPLVTYEQELYKLEELLLALQNNNTLRSIIVPDFDIYDIYNAHVFLDALDLLFKHNQILKQIKISATYARNRVCRVINVFDRDGFIYVHQENCDNAIDEYEFSAYPHQETGYIKIYSRIDLESNLPAFNQHLSSCSELLSLSSEGNSSEPESETKRRRILF